MEAESNIAEQFAKYCGKLDYADFFTDPVAKECISSSKEMFFRVKAKDKIRVLSSISSTVVVYSLLIYKLYGASPEFQNRINSSKELRANFKAMKSFLDANDGEKIAEAYVEKVDGYLS